MNYNYNKVQASFENINNSDGIHAFVAEQISGPVRDAYRTVVHAAESIVERNQDYYRDYGGSEHNDMHEDNFDGVVQYVEHNEYDNAVKEIDMNIDYIKQYIKSASSTYMREHFEQAGNIMFNAKQFIQHAQNYSENNYDG